MVRIRTMSLTALALGSGLLSPVGAQQYSAPLGGEIQLYSRPLESEEATPAPLPSPPSPTPYAAPEPMPEARYPQYPPQYPQQHPQYPDDEAGSDWLPPAGLLQIQDYQGIRYVSGGVGENERAELNALSGQFNLRLLFAMQGSGDYLADVQVNIVDSRGAVVLNTTSNGPWFLAQLPPGGYTVEVNALGQTQRQIARVDGIRQSRLNFYWR